MAEALGSLLVTVILIFVGVFLMVAAYSRKEVLLKLATMGTLRIDPDNPGTTPRAVMFGVGVTLVLVGVVLIVVEKLLVLLSG